MQTMEAMHTQWIKDFLKHIENLPDSDFELMKANVLNVIGAKYNSLADKCNFLTEQLDSQTYD